VLVVRARKVFRSDVLITALIFGATIIFPIHYDAVAPESQNERGVLLEMETQNTDTRVHNIHQLEYGRMIIDDENGHYGQRDFDREEVDLTPILKEYRDSNCAKSIRCNIKLSASHTNVKAIARLAEELCSVV
jgi:hypothetical protein